MIRHILGAAVLVAVFCVCSHLKADFYQSGIIPEPTAKRHGLARPWYTQIQMDRGQGRVRHVVLHDGALYVASDRAMVHAIDAETGKTLWAKQIGRPDHPTMRPGLSNDLLAIVNGSQLYVVNRYNGDLLYKTEVGGAPGAGPGVSEKRAYIPMISGLVMAYRLEPLTDPMRELGKIKKDLTEEEKAEMEQDRRDNLRLNQEYVPPLTCFSQGKAMVQPIIARENEGEEYVIWPTDAGFMNIGRVDRRSEDRLTVKFRLETDEGIAAQPTYLPSDPDDPSKSGVIYAASRDGFVHAVEENSGDSLWRFSTGEPILEPAVVIGDRVFVATQPGGMFCIEAKTGKELWWAPRIQQFVSASKERVYAVDKVGRMLVLHAKTGTRLDTFPIPGLPIRLLNTTNDRIFLANTTGVIQCLHEIELTDPFVHRIIKEEEEAPEIEQRGLDEAAAEVEAKPEKDPFDDVGGDDPFGAEEGDPFGGGGDAGAGGGAGGGADPFGAGGGDPFGSGDAAGGDAAGGDAAGGGAAGGAAGGGGGAAGGGAGGGAAGGANPFGGDPFGG